MQNRKKIRLALILQIFIAISLKIQPVFAAGESDWVTWKNTIHAQFQSILAKDKSKHPEFNSLPNRACTVSFEVTTGPEVANIRSVKKSGFENFDREANELVFFQRHNPIFVFPKNTSDSFVRCQISVYPDGTISPMLIKHPKAGEVFVNKVKIENITRPTFYPVDLPLEEDKK